MIPEFDPCAPEEWSSKIKESIGNFLDNVERVLDDISFTIYGNYILVMVAMLAFVMGVKALNALAMVVTSFVGNVVGTFNSLVALGFSLITGVKIMIRYLAAQFLIIQLKNRIKLSTLLKVDLTDMVEFFSSIDRISGALDGLGSQSSHIAAKENLDTASRLIIKNIKSAKSEESGNVVQQDLKDAVRQLDLAIGKITGFPELQGSMIEDLNKINQKYKIPLQKAHTSSINDAPDRFASPSKSIIQIPDPLAFPKSIKHAMDHFLESLFVEELQADGSKKTVVNQQVRAEMRNYLIDLVRTPGIQEIFRAFVVTAYVNKKMEILGQRLPIKALVAKDLLKRGAGALLTSSSENNKFFGKVKSAADQINEWREAAENSVESVVSYLDLGEMGQRDYPEKSNLASYSALVNTSQIAILSLPSWEKIISFKSGKVASVLLPPALNLITKTRNDIVIRNGKKFSTLENQERALAYTFDLNKAKALIASSLQQDISFTFPGAEGSVNMRPEDIERQFQNSLNIWTQLEDSIFARRTIVNDDGSITAKETESSIIMNVVDKHLSGFVLGNLNLIQARNRQNMLIALQSISFLIDEMLRRDNLELILAESFVASVDANPIFHSVIKPAWEAFMKAIGTSGLGKNISDSLQNGNLAVLAGQVGSAMYALEEFSELTICGKELFDMKTELLSEALGAPDEEAKAMVKRAKRKIGELKDQKDKMLMMVKDMEEKMEAKKKAFDLKKEEAAREALAKKDRLEREAKEKQQKLQLKKAEAKLKAANDPKVPK